MRGESPLRCKGRVKRIARATEGHKKGITRRVDLDAAVLGAGCANETMVVGTEDGEAIPERAQEKGRAFDVGEEERDNAARKVVARLPL